MKNIKESYEIKRIHALDGLVKEVTRNRATVSLYKPYMKIWGVSDFRINSEEYCLRYMREDLYFAQLENRIEIQKQR